MNPRPIDEAEEEANKKTFGDDYVRRVPTHFRGYTIDDNGQKTPVVRLEVATPRNFQECKQLFSRVRGWSKAYG